MEAVNLYKGRSIQYNEFINRLSKSIETYGGAVAIAENMNDAEMKSSVYKNLASTYLNLLRHFKETQ